MDISTIVDDFLETLQTRSSFEELLPFYHHEVTQIEFPNLLTREKACRSLEDLKLAAEKGKGVLKSEQYEIVNKYAFESTVIVEAIWTGVLAIPLGNLQAGEELKAHFAQFYEFEDGKIIQQRNYDCFEHFK